VLAIADTALGYCALVDINGAPTYISALTIITQGHANSEIAALRVSPEYAKAKAAFSAGLATVPNATGVSACRSLAPATHSLGTTTPIRTPKMGSDH
jgi:hypothetical protein